MDPIPKGSLKNLIDLTNGYPCKASVFQLGEWQLLEGLAVLVQSNGSNSALSSVVYGDIALSINTQYKYNAKIQLHDFQCTWF